MHPMRQTWRPGLTPINAVLLATAICVASTVVLAAVPRVPYAFHMQYAKVMLQTAVVVISAVAGFLVVGRVRETRRLRSLLLAAALFLTTLGGGAFGLLALTESPPGGARWAALFAA